MLHLTATRVDGHGIISLSEKDVPTLLFWVIRIMKERGWVGASVTIRNEAREVVFDAVVPTILPADPTS
jgi:hypothetical protein